MRGLKPRQAVYLYQPCQVASFTDAWIETTLTTALTRPKPSHLLQMRGLKLYSPYITQGYVQSHLLQMRGLKQIKTYGSILMILVASFTDAWIETNTISNDILPFRSHLLQMRGLKRSQSNGQP